MIPHPLNYFNKQKYYQNEHKFNGVYSRNNLPKIKDWVYIMNVDKYKSIGAYWIDLYVNGNSLKYFGSFRVKQILKKIWKFIGNKNIRAIIEKGQW